MTNMNRKGTNLNILDLHQFWKETEKLYFKRCCPIFENNVEDLIISGAKTNNIWSLLIFWLQKYTINV